MPGKLTSVRYDSLVQRLERMADGIIRHKQEEGFPKTLDDAKRRAVRQQLEDGREKYEASTKAAQQAYDVYYQSLIEAEKLLAKDDDLVKGFYGKKNSVVADFGTKVMANPRPRKAKTPSTQK